MLLSFPNFPGWLQICLQCSLVDFSLSISYEESVTALVNARGEAVNNENVRLEFPTENRLSRNFANSHSFASMVQKIMFLKRLSLNRALFHISLLYLGSHIAALFLLLTVQFQLIECHRNFN